MAKSRYNSLDENDKIQFNKDIKLLAKYYYKYYRSIVMRYISL